MKRAEIIKKIRYILQSGQCPSYFTNKCKNDGACGRCENEAMDRLIAEYDAQIRVDERTKAERDFQNSDYWNDYLEKVLADERTKVLDEVDKYLRELSDIKSGCGEWIEHHDAELMRRTREQETNFVERKCKELGIDYIQIYTCDSAD